MKLEDEYLSLSSIAKDLDCSVRTVRLWVQTGKLEAEQLFGRNLVRRDYYNEWKQRNIVKRKVC